MMNYLTSLSLSSPLSSSLSLSTDISAQTITCEWWTDSQDLKGEVDKTRPLSHRRSRGHRGLHHLAPWKPLNQSDTGGVCPRTGPARQRSRHMRACMSKYVTKRRRIPMLIQRRCCQLQRPTLGSKMASTLSGTSSSSESEFPALMSRCSKADSSTRRP